MLGLGYPGGPAIQRLAEDGDPEAFELPVAMSRDPGLDFSFSGLKTALVYLCRDLGAGRGRGAPRRPRRLLPGGGGRPADREARPGAEAGRLGAVALGGGVAANGPLREAVAALCERRGVGLKLVPLELCTDNAAMIGSAARFAPRHRVPGIPRIRRLPDAKAAA